MHKIYYRIIEKLTQLFHNSNFYSFFSCVFTLFIVLFYYSSYLTNDDVAILMDIRSGYPTSFMSVSLGRILSLLYLKVNFNFPWYSVFFLIINIVSLILIFRYISLLKIKSHQFLTVIFVILLTYSSFLLKIGYTNTAFFLSIAAIANLWLYLSQNKPQEIRIIVYGLLFAISFLIRTKSVLGVMLFSLPILILIISLYLNKLKYIILFFLPLILFMGIEYYQAHYSVSELQTNFIKFNQIRGKIHGYPKYSIKDNYVMLSANNWSENDYDMFMAWSFIDETIYNPQTLQNVIELTPNIDISLFSIKHLFYNFISQFSKQFLLLVLVSMWFSRSKLSSFRNILLISYFIYSFFMLFYMYACLRIPSRISEPLFLLILLNTIYLALSPFKMRLILDNYVKIKYLFRFIK